MQPVDRRDLHWQPLAAAEREAHFDRLDAVLAGRPPVRPDEEAHQTYTCPDGDTPTMRRHYRYGAGGTTYCPNCGWEAPPF